MFQPEPFSQGIFPTNLPAFMLCVQAEGGCAAEWLALYSTSKYTAIHKPSPWELTWNR